MDKALVERELEYHRIWADLLYKELIQRAMLEIECRAPLRRLSDQNLELEKELGMRRGAS